MRYKPFRNRPPIAGIFMIGETEMKPYAVYLLERFQAGESVQELSVREGIPLERIRMRLVAASDFVWKRKGATNTLGDFKRAA